MKIVFLTHHEAIAPRLLLEIRTLRKEGHEVTVLAWNTSGKEYAFEFPITFIQSGSRVRFYQSLRQGLPATLKRIALLYRSTFRELMALSFDVAHCGHLTLLPLAVLAKLLKGCRVVYDSYEFHSLNITSKLGNRNLAQITRMVLDGMEAVLVGFVDGILTVPSRADAERIKFSKRCGNVEVLLNVPPSNGGTFKKTFFSPPAAIYIGAIKREKGLYAMLEATSLLAGTYPDFRLHLVGAMEEDPLEVAERIRALNIHEHVFISPWVPPEDLDRFLSDAWVGLWPSQPTQCLSRVTIGNSRKVFMYMKYGLPAVASASGEIGKAIGEEQAGLLIDASRPEAMAQAIREIIENAGLRERMSENGIAAVREKYNWENESGKFLGLYNALDDRE